MASRDWPAAAKASLLHYVNKPACLWVSSLVTSYLCAWSWTTFIFYYHIQIYSIMYVTLYLAHFMGNFRAVNVSVGQLWWAVRDSDDDATLWSGTAITVGRPASGTELWRFRLGNCKETVIAHVDWLAKQTSSVTITVGKSIVEIWIFSSFFTTSNLNCHWQLQVNKDVRKS